MKINFFKRFALVCAGAAALTAAALTGCSKMEEPTGLGVQHVEQGTIAAAGGEVTFTVHPGSMDDWTITFLDAEGVGFETLDWIQLSKASGSGETKVTATVAANANVWQREAKAIVNAGDRKIPIPIVQAPAPTYFRVTPEALTGLPWSEGGLNVNRILTVESNMQWHATITRPSVPRWILSSYDSDNHGTRDQLRQGDEAVELNIENHLEYVKAGRTATVTFYGTDGAVLATVPVSQKARPWLQIDIQPQPLPDENAYYPNTLVPSSWGPGVASSHELTIAATLFNSNEPITYTWYYNWTRTTDDDTVEGGTLVPAEWISNDGKTVSLTWERFNASFGGGFFYCVVSSPGADSKTSDTVELWASAGGLG